MYIDTAANFVRDGGPQPEVLPFESDERIYTQGQRHALMKKNNVIGGGPLPWPDGDAIIANAPSYIAAKNKRERSALLSPTLDMGGTIASVIGN